MRQEAIGLVGAATGGLDVIGFLWSFDRLSGRYLPGLGTIGVEERAESGLA